MLELHLLHGEAETQQNISQFLKDSKPPNDTFKPLPITGN